MILYFKPKQLGAAALPPEELARDKIGCKKYGPCGVGEKALYLNSFFIDRCFYVPISSVRRVFKRVALSKGGFTGRGMFASIPYLVVEYDGGVQKQCIFKDEGHADLLLAHLERTHPDIPRLSEAGERRLAEQARREAERELKELSPQAQAAREELERAEAKLAERPDLAVWLSQAARRKRGSDQSNPAYKWVALTVVIAGALALLYGLWTVFSGDTTGLYFLLFGLAAVFFFSGAQVLPTAKNNRRAVAREWDEARAAAGEFIGERFPVPCQYAHPVVLRRMVRIIREGRAQTVEEALERLKDDLRALNSSVQVEQEEYDEVVSIKPMFLLCGYK